jgi:hypothetical protein
MWRRDGRRNGYLWLLRSFRFCLLYFYLTTEYSVSGSVLVFPLYHLFYNGTS